MKGNLSDLEKLKKTAIIYTLRIGLFKEKLNEVALGSLSVKVKDNEFWTYELIKTKFNFLDYYPSSPHPIAAPARAYSKVLEAQEFTSLDIKSGSTVVEIGSAPGGISYYLLDLGINLIAIDPAEMDPSLRINFSKNYKHIQKSIFEIERRHLPHKVDWVISDLNLMGDLNVNQSLKIMNFYPDILGAFLTIKTPNPEDILKIKEWQKPFFKKFKIEVMNLPSHKKEIGFVLKRKA